jgi:ABC-type uncharacterized transport system auxiliary subunit
MSIVMRETPIEVGLPQFNRPQLVRSPLLLTISLLGLLLAGCGASRPIRYYQLTYAPAAPATQSALNVTLLVRSFDATHLFKEDRIMYSVNANEVGAYEDSRWIAPPVEILQTALVRGLRSSGQFRTIFTVRGEGGGDYALTGYLYQFGEVDGSEIVARLNYIVRMRDRTTGNILWSHTYNHDEPATDKSIPAVVAAMDKNVQRSVQEVNAGLVEYFQANPPK